MKASALERKPRHLHNFTGLSVKQFESLCAAVAEERQQQNINAAGAPGRQRAVGGGRKSNLALEEQVLAVLMYYRLYMTQVLLGYLFGLDDSNVSRLITRLRPVLLRVLPIPAREQSLFGQERPERRVSSLATLLAKHPEINDVLIDATEQEVYKPKDKQQRKERYSGKKKCHSLKTQLTTTPGGLVLHLSDALPGRVHDITVLRGTGVLPQLGTELIIRLDKGYDGIQTDFPDHRFEQAYKARRNKPLDLIQKLVNRSKNCLRLPVEHCIAHLKRFKVLAGIFRGNIEHYSDDVCLVAGLHNFRKRDALAW